MKKLLAHINIFARLSTLEAEAKNQHKFNTEAAKAIYLISTALDCVGSTRHPMSALYGDDK